MFLPWLMILTHHTQVNAGPRDLCPSCSLCLLSLCSFLFCCKILCHSQMQIILDLESRGKRETPGLGKNYDWDVFEVVSRQQICHLNWPLIGQLTLFPALSLALNCKLFIADVVSSSLVSEIALTTEEDAWWNIWEIIAFVRVLALVSVGVWTVAAD